MPFTPLHFGPSAALGWCFRKHVEWTALLLSNVAVDLEPLLLPWLAPGRPEHGLSHTLIGAGTIAAVFSAVHILWAKRRGRSKAWGRVFLSSATGALSNVVIDAVVYPEVMLFYPWDGNPLFGLASEPVVAAVCGVMTAGWLWIVWNNKRKEGIGR